jgi:hypothetical protein
LPFSNDDEVSKLISAAADLPPERFVSEHLLGDRAFIFAWETAPYNEFRMTMAGLLGVAPGQVRLIGSAKLGFSLNTSNLLRKFRSDSDLDLIVVASDMFDECVLELRQRATELELAGIEERRRLRKTREFIPDGFLRPDKLPLGCSLMKKWFPLLAGPFDSEPARSHIVKAWLFKSWEHARLCYTDHQRQIQPIIQSMRKRAEEKENQK